MVTPEVARKFFETLDSAERILIVSHPRPDGDTLGCQLALGLAIILLGKKVILLSQDGVPTRFQFLPGSELVLSETDETGRTVGDFSPADLALSAGYARRLEESEPLEFLEGMSAGVAVKYVHSRILDSAQTAAVDLGLLSRAFLDDRLRLAFTAANLGGGMRFEGETEPLPTSLRFGGAYQLRRRWLAGLDLALPRDNNPVVALGTECLAPIAGPWRLAGRAGFNSRTSGDVDGVTVGTHSLTHLSGNEEKRKQYDQFGHAFDGASRDRGFGGFSSQGGAPFGADFGADFGSVFFGNRILQRRWHQNIHRQGQEFFVGDGAAFFQITNTADTITAGNMAGFFFALESQFRI